MEYIKKYYLDIEKTIISIINKDIASHEKLKTMIKYAFGFVDKQGKELNEIKYRGKRLRPGLLLLLCDSLGCDHRKALPIAAAIEIFHNFSLVHDDIMDNDKKRRWKRTNWDIFGIPQSINTGDAMLILSNLAILRISSKEIRREDKLYIIDIINRAFLKIIEGQFLDLSFEEREDVGIREYLNMINKKTAVLFGVCCEAAALVAEEKKATVEFLRKLGLYFGLSFQIKNDIEGVWGGFEKSGKTGASDLKKRKKTLPIIYAMQKLPLNKKKLFLQIYRKKRIDNNDIKKLILYMNEVNARVYSDKLAQNYKLKALNFLNKIKMKNSAKKNILTLLNINL